MSLIISDASDLGSDLIDISKQFDVVPLKTIGEKIKTLCDEFDSDAVENEIEILTANLERWLS